MARARNIKPGFFKNEDLAECSPWARLCFAGLWTLADRDGRLEDRPKRIKGELFAFDSIEVEPLLAELAKYGFILRYKAEDGRGLIQVIEFAKHQNPHHREPSSDLPPPKSLGLEVDATAQEPEALVSCDGAKAPDKPRACLGLDPPRSDFARGSSRAEPGIDESGTMNPGEKKRARKRATPPPTRPTDVAERVWSDWLRLREAKRAPVTETVIAEAVREAGKAGMTLEAFLSVWCSRGSQGLQADWLRPTERHGGSVNGRAPVGAMSEHGLQTMRNAKALEARLFGAKTPEKVEEVGDGA